MTVMIVSKEKQNEFLKEIHECPIGGHQGVQYTYERLKLCHMARHVSRR